MEQSKGKFLSIIILVVGFALLISANAAAVPYYSYTYDFWGNAVPAPQAYVPVEVYKGTEIGADSSSSFVDLFVHCDEVYVVDANNNAIIVLDSSFRQIDVIRTMQGSSGIEYFSSPQDVFVTDTGLLYIADRDNNRVVVINRSGNILKEINASVADTDLFPASFRPQKVAVDPVGRVYVLAAGVYDGIMEFRSDGKFRGYVGAPRVAPSFIEYLWYRLSTEEQRQRRPLFLPVEHSNLAIDQDGMIMATVSGGAINPEEAVRRLNPAGVDLLLREGFFPPIGDLGNAVRSVFVDVLPRNNGVYSVLDRANGRIFTYDANGNLLYVFGGHGQLTGLFQNPVALAEMNGRILVLDSAANELTVFAPTPYAELIHAAIAAYDTGKYEESEELWYQVLKLNSNYELAYSSVGRTLLMQGDYGEALDMFMLGNDRIGYSKAFQRLRHEFAKDNFSLIMTLLFASIVIIRVVLKLKNKQGTAASEGIYAAAAVGFDPEGSKWVQTAVSLRYGLHVIFHPFDGFWDLKHEQRGSVSAATIIAGASAFTYVIMRQYTGFVFNELDLTRFNILVEVGSVLVPFLLWCIVNWALTTIMQGKGTLKDVYIASSYALIPFVIINLPLTLVSNFLIWEEAPLYYLVLVVSVVWSIMLLIFGTMVTHDYTLGKTAYTVVLILAGMLFCLFIGILFVSLLDRIYLFLNDLYAEYALRT